MHLALLVSLLHNQNRSAAQCVAGSHLHIVNVFEVNVARRAWFPRRADAMSMTVSTAAIFCTSSPVPRSQMDTVELLVVWYWSQ